MLEEPQEEITILLGKIAAGSEAAKEKLVDLVYGRLHQIAQALMPRERSNHTLQPTALVHEAYFKLIVGKPLQASNRAYFFGARAPDRNRGRSASRFESEAGFRRRP